MINAELDPRPVRPDTFVNGVEIAGIAYDLEAALVCPTLEVHANEVAYILSQHSERSLIILDEVGRGTSTYDGLSIAWAIVEHLHRSPERGPRTLFATHYQELTQLEKYLPRLRNFSVAVGTTKSSSSDALSPVPRTAATASRSRGWPDCR